MYTCGGETDLCSHQEYTGLLLFSYIIHCHHLKRQTGGSTYSSVWLSVEDILDSSSRICEAQQIPFAGYKTSRKYTYMDPAFDEGLEENIYSKTSFVEAIRLRAGPQQQNTQHTTDQP